MNSKAKEPIVKAESDTEVEVIKAGRPCIYEDWMNDAIVEVAKEGGHIAAMCIKIGIRSEDTFHRWKREIPAFKEAYDEARMHSKALYEQNLLRGSLGLIKDFNATAYMCIINNKFPEDYKRDRTGGGDANITINNLTLTPEQLDYKIAQKTELLKSMGITIPALEQNDSE